MAKAKSWQEIVSGVGGSSRTVSAARVVAVLKADDAFGEKFVEVGEVGFGGYGFSRCNIQKLDPTRPTSCPDTVTGGPRSRIVNRNIHFSPYSHTIEKTTMHVDTSHGGAAVLGQGARQRASAQQSLIGTVCIHRLAVSTPAWCHETENRLKVLARTVITHA